MSLPPKPASSVLFRPRPPARADERGALAVGSRVLVTTSGSQRNVELMNEDGVVVGTTLPADEPVTITAWRPRRMAPARYRVRAVNGVEGWIDATNLRRLPPPAPTPPPPAPVAATPAAPAQSRPKVPVAKPAATKPGNRKAQAARKPTTPRSRPRTAAKRRSTRASSRKRRK